MTPFSLETMINSDSSWISESNMAYPVWYTSKELPEATIGVEYSTTLYISDPDNTEITLVDLVPNHYLPEGLFVIPPNTLANITTGQPANNTDYYVIAGTPTSATFGEYSQTVQFVLRATNDGDKIDETFIIRLHHHEQYPEWNNYKDLSVLGSGVTVEEFSETTVTHVKAGTNLQYTATGLPDGLSIDKNGVISGTLPYVLDAKFYIFSVTITNDAVSDDFNILNTKRYIPVEDATGLSSSDDDLSSSGVLSSNGSTFRSSSENLSAYVGLSSSIRDLSAGTVAVSKSTYREPWSVFEPTKRRPIWFNIDPLSLTAFSVNDIYYLTMPSYPAETDSKDLYYIGEIDNENNRVSLSYTKDNGQPVEFTEIQQDITFTRYVDVLEKKFSIDVELLTTTDPYWITPSDLGNFVEKTDVAFYVQIDDRGNPDVNFYITNDSIVPGNLTIDKISGLVSGTLPDVIIPVEYSFEIGASDGQGINIVREFKMRVDPATPINLVWTMPSDIGAFPELTDSTIELSVSTLNPDGTTSPVDNIDIRVSVKEGTLPSGLRINNDNMSIEGIFPRTLNDKKWVFKLGASLVYNGTAIELPTMDSVFSITINNVFNNDICTVEAEYSFDHLTRSTISSEIIQRIDRTQLYKSTNSNFGIQKNLRFPISAGLEITKRAIFVSKLFDSKEAIQSDVLSFDISGHNIVMSTWSLETLAKFINDSRLAVIAEISEDITSTYNGEKIYYKIVLHSLADFDLTNATELGQTNITETIKSTPQGMLDHLYELGQYILQGANNPLRYKNIKWSDLERFDVRVGEPAIETGVYNEKHIYDVIYLPIEDTFRRKKKDETDGQYLVDKFDTVGNTQYMTEERVKSGDIKLYRANKPTTGTFNSDDWDNILYFSDVTYTVYNSDNNYLVGDFVISESDYYPTSKKDITPSNLRNVRNIIEQTLGFEDRNKVFNVTPLWYTSNEFRAPFIYTKPGYAKIILNDIKDIFNQNTSLLGANISIDNVIFSRRDNDRWGDFYFEETTITSASSTSDPDLADFARTSGIFMIGDTDYIENLDSVNVVSTDSLNDVVTNINNATSKVKASIKYQQYAESTIIRNPSNLEHRSLRIKCPDGTYETFAATNITLSDFVDTINARYDSTKVSAYVNHIDIPYIEEHISGSSVEFQTIDAPLHKFSNNDKVEFNAISPIVGLIPGNDYYVKTLSDSKIQLLANFGDQTPLTLRKTASFLTTPFDGSIPALGQAFFVNDVPIIIRNPVFPATNVVEQIANDINYNVPDVSAMIINDRLSVTAAWENLDIVFKEYTANQQNTKGSIVYNSLLAYFGVTSSKLTPPSSKTYTSNIAPRPFTLTRGQDIIDRLVLETTEPEHGVIVNETGEGIFTFDFEVNHHLELNNSNGTNIVVYDPQMSGVTQSLGIQTDEEFEESSVRVVINNKYLK